MIPRWSLVWVVSFMLAGSGAWSADQASVLRLVADVPLPGAAVRFDYQSVDTLANRLYIAHMNAGQVVVFDLAARQVVKTIGDLPRVTGICAVSALGKVYASAAGEHHVAVIDARSLAVVARVGDIDFPDGIAYAPAVNKIYVSDESGKKEVVIDGATDRVLTEIPLEGEAGNTIYDPGSGHVLVAVQTKNQVVEIDPTQDKVVGRHTLFGADHPHGMSLDPMSRLLFVANEDNAMLLVVDLKTMTVVDHRRVGDDPDVLAFDPVHHRLYVAAESGIVKVFSVRKGELVEDGGLEMRHAHTVAVDPRTETVYFPLQDIKGHPVLRIMSPRRS